MIVERHGLQAVSTGLFMSGAWGTVACAVIAAAALCGGAAEFSASRALAQEAAAPAKPKASKAKSAAKAKETPAETEGDPQAPAAAAKRDPAQAQRNLDTGIKLLQAGKAEQAIQTLSTVISGGNLPPQIMARALHQRGAAYRAAGKPAQAVSDLTSALWLKGGLTDADRADAVQQRAAAYREAGIPDQTDAGDTKTTARRSAPAPSAVGASQSPSAPSVTTASLAPEAAPRPAEQSTPLGNFFNNLFGSGSSNSSAPAPSASAPAGNQQPAASSWSSSTTTTPATASPPTKTARAAAIVAPPPQAMPQATPAPATPAKAAPTGSIDARMIFRTEAEANAHVGRLTSEFGAHLGGRAPSVSQAQFGNMGSFFQVRVGPYKSTAEAQDLCKRIKSTGADCVAVSQ